MPAVQTVYPAAIPLGFPGMVANGETSNRISRTVEDAAGIAFGLPAFRGAGDHGVTGTPTAGALMGITIADHGIQILAGGVAADIMAQYSSAALMTLGMIWVNSATATTDGAQVYATAVTGVITATVGSNIIMPGWFFEDTIAAPGLARIVRR